MGCVDLSGRVEKRLSRQEDSMSKVGLSGGGAMATVRRLPDQREGCILRRNEKYGQKAKLWPVTDAQTAREGSSEATLLVQEGIVVFRLVQ